MKAKELMTLDLVISNKRGKKEVLRVISIDAGSNTAWLDGDGYSGLVSCDDIELIPLTEDILKANGFENIIGYECYYSTPLLRQSGIVVTINSEMVVTNWTDHNDNVFVEFSCAFVHELQHALRMCGLRELADNFKLKMEE